VVSDPPRPGPKRGEEMYSPGKKPEPPAPGIANAARVFPRCQFSTTGHAGRRRIEYEFFLRSDKRMSIDA